MYNKNCPSYFPYTDVAIDPSDLLPLYTAVINSYNGCIVNLFQHTAIICFNTLLLLVYIHCYYWFQYTGKISVNKLQLFVSIQTTGTL
jgi:hypothetical protein